MSSIYSIGHSTRSLEEFIDLLKENKVELLADVRRFPGSRRLPYFNKDNLQIVLPKRNIEYAHFEDLGGRRRSAKIDSPNGGWRNSSFQSYADYMLSDTFKNAISKLLELADERRTVIMCAEAVYWRCHRRLISDYLLALRGIVVQHILGPNQLRKHKLEDFAKVENDTLFYPPALWDLVVGAD